MLDSPQLLPEKHSNRSILLLCHCCVFLMLLQMSKRGRLQSTRGALWVFNTVPGLKPRAVCLRGCVFEYPALWPQLSENAHSFTMPWFGEMTSLQGIPGDWSCCLQSSAERGTVRFGSGSWLIFGTRAISQGCSPPLHFLCATLRPRPVLPVPMGLSKLLSILPATRLDIRKHLRKDGGVLEQAAQRGGRINVSGDF